MTTDIELLTNALKDKGITKQEYIRIQAVLMRKRKMKRSDIVEIIGKSLDSVEDWIMAYNREGIKGLMTKKPKEKNGSKLTNKQRNQIKGWLNKGTPQEMGISDQDYWDIGTLKKLVSTKYGVEYKSRTSYTSLFDYCGFSYQRVEFVDRRRDQSKVDNFKKRYEMKSKEGRIVMSW